MSRDDLYGKILAYGQKVIRQQVALPGLVNRQTTEDLNQRRPRRGNVSIIVPPQYNTRSVTPGPTPPAHSSPAEEESVVNLGLDYWEEVDFAMTDKDMALLDDPSGTPIMNLYNAAGAIAAKISETIAAQYKGIYGYVGTAGTTPFASAPTVAQQARTALTNQKCPRQMRQMVLNADAYGNAIALPQMAANQRGDGQSAAYIDARVPRTMGFDWHEDLELPTHTNSGGSGWLVNQADHAVGDNTVVIDTGSGNPAEGDIFTVAGDTQTYVVTNYASNTITYAPKAKVAWANNAAITFKASHAVNLAFHPYAFGFASAPEDTGRGPDDRVSVMSMPDEMTGVVLSLEIKREHKQWGYYLSCLWGTKLVDPRLACRIAG